jgi:hypothetical protein
VVAPSAASLAFPSGSISLGRTSTTLAALGSITLTDTITFSIFYSWPRSEQLAKSAATSAAPPAKPYAFSLVASARLL